MENTTTSYSSLLMELDRSFIWHPFTQMKAFSPILIIRGKGSYLYSADGNRYLDGISSWWVNLHGHTHPYIIKKLQSQVEILEHLSFADFTHPPAIELAMKLISVLPGEMSKVFYSDNGSTSVEVALKIAFQYWYNQNTKTQKREIICFKHSYHGDTFGSMSAAGKNVFNKPFWKMLFDVQSIDPPIAGKEEESLAQLINILKRGKSACFIFEPLILGSGGMVIYSPNGLDLLLQTCQKYHVLTIADEVMTGFGRTGTLFACETLSQKPDMICLSKGLTGGFLPLGVTACKQYLFDAFLSDNLHQAFLHGHSYTANPLACATALANLDLLEKQECSLQREMIARHHQNFCRKWKNHPKLKRCESLGTILALEYDSKDQSLAYFQPIRDKLYHFFLNHKILLRPLGNVLYVLPPYCIESHELELIYEHIILTLEGTL